MADFNLTQTDAQVQSILNDAQDAQGAGAQTTLTTDYIMLKGTNGRYHKIQKGSFTEAVRNTLASLLVNNDKGTTISQIAAIASGDFGSVTPANLALVLGGVALSISSPLNSMDDIDVSYPNVFVNSSYAPSDAPLVGSLLVFNINTQSTVKWQFVTNGSFSAIKTRVYAGGAWTAWKTITTT